MLSVLSRRVRESLPDFDVSSSETWSLRNRIPSRGKTPWRLDTCESPHSFFMALSKHHFLGSRKDTVLSWKNVLVYRQMKSLKNETSCRLILVGEELLTQKIKIKTRRFRSSLLHRNHKIGENSPIKLTVMKTARPLVLCVQGAITEATEGDSRSSVVDAML